MAVVFGSGVTVIQSFWTTFKASVVAKQLAMQYQDDGIITSVFAFDGSGLAYACIIYDGTVPDGIIATYSQAQNNADLSDFQTNWLPVSNFRVTPNAYEQVILNNATITANGNKTVTGQVNRQIDLFVNVTIAPTGTTPGLQFTLQEVDPGNLITPVGSSIVGTTIIATGTQTLSLIFTTSNAVKVSWVITGTSSPTFTGVYVTVSSKDTTASTGLDGNNVEHPVLLDSSGRAVTVGAGIAGTPAGGVVSIQGVASGTTIPISGTISNNQGSPNTLSNGWPVELTDGYNILGTVSHPLQINVDGYVQTNPNVILSGTSADNTINSTTKLPVLAAVANASAPTWSNNNMVPLSVDTSGNLRVAGSFTSAGAADTTATGSISTLNATVQVAMAGQNGAGMQLASGTLIGTIVPEISLDGGTTWIGTFFENPSNGAITSSVIFSSNNTAVAQTIVGTGGASHVRVRVSAFTSGAAVCNLRASIMNDPALIWTGPSNTAAPPNAAQIAGMDATGNLQVPQVDKILGETVQQLSVAATLTSPKAAAVGLAADVTAYGSLRVQTEPAALFNDPFTGNTVDTTNRWITITSGAGAAVTQANGNITLTASTTANAYASLSSQATFSPVGLGFIWCGAVLQFEAIAVTGQSKFWGLGTMTSVPTVSAALQDAIGIEQDTTGTLSAVVYSAGTKIFGQALNRLNDGYFHRIAVITRPDYIIWYLEGAEIPVATTQYNTPSNQALPVHMHVVNGASPSSAGTFNTSAQGVGNTALNSLAISDTTYPWRQSTVKPASTPVANTDTALVVAVSQNNSIIMGGSDGVANRTSFVDANGQLSVSNILERYLLEQVVNNQTNYGNSFTDILSYIKNSLISFSKNISPVYVPINQLPITITLAGLASAGQRSSTTISNISTLCLDALVQVKVRSNAAGTSATGLVNIYAYSSIDGYTYEENLAGLDMGVTLTTPPNLRLIGSINVVANSTTYISSLMSVAQAYNGWLPPTWGIVVENKSGAALDALFSNFSVKYILLQQKSS
jgi:hypothetical protein